MPCPCENMPPGKPPGPLTVALLCAVGGLWVAACLSSALPVQLLFVGSVALLITDLWNAKEDA